MDTYRLRQMSNEYRAAALLGTWAKTGRGEYTRISGEVIRKNGSAWFLDGQKYGYASLALAMQMIDTKHN